MNRVLEVDEELGYALLEPGVSFFDLYEHLRANGHRLWMSAPGLGWGSVVGNALERGFGQAPYGEHSAAICGLEVVMADGDLVRTGMGSIGDGRAWHVYKGGYGPSLDGLFLQSNYGVVTKMGLWLMPEPESFRACEVTFARDEDFVAMIETLRPLKVGETITGSARAANAVRVAQGTTQRSRWSDDPAPLSRSSDPGDGRRARHRLVEPALRALRPRGRRRGALPHGAGRVRPHPGRAGHEPALRRERHRGRDRARGPTAGRHPEHDVLRDPRLAGGRDRSRRVLAAVPAARRGRRPPGADGPVTGVEHGFDYSAGLTCGTRFLNHIFMILFDPTDDEETGRARRLFEVLVREGAASGYGEYRTHLEFMDLVAEQYDFHGGSQRRLNETIKDALDPNGILSPGKQGIWPRSCDYATTSMPMRSSSVASSGRSTSSTA